MRAVALVWLGLMLALPLAVLFEHGLREGLVRFWDEITNPIALGAVRLTIFAAMKLANTSFIQTSSNHFIVTRSPNHMCAVSCEITAARPRSWFLVAASSSSRPLAL